MKNTLKLLTLILVIASLLCACGGNTAAAPEKVDAPVIELDAEDKELLEALGSDINVVAPADFAATVAALNSDASGQLYQLTGYFQAAAEGEENPSLADAASNPQAAVAVRYLTVELVPGAQYTVTGVINVEEHDGHAHITFDAMTVESYIAK